MAENMVHIPMKRPSGTDAVLDHESVPASAPPIGVMPTKRAKLSDQNKEMNQKGKSQWNNPNTIHRNH